MLIYHGSDHVIVKPQYGLGKEDNDYCSGFYTTNDKIKADEWALCNGQNTAITNVYEINETKLNVLHLDDYGTLSWIAEIVAHRGARGELAQKIGNMLIDKYKIDTSKADIIIGYRADDSYIDIVDAFLKKELSIEEVDRLFRKGNLGLQIFIKSEAAFNALVYKGHREIPQNKELSNNEIQARIEVSNFLNQREQQIILNNFVPNGILISDVIERNFVYNKVFNYYYEADKDIGDDYDER
jgi:hypothetical protein